MRTRNDRPPSSGQALTALGTAVCKHAATTNRRHTVTEAVTALADKLAWLIRAFHGTSPCKIARCIRSWRRQVNDDNAVFARLTKVFSLRGFGRHSQMTGRSRELDPVLMERWLLLAAQLGECRCIGAFGREGGMPFPYGLQSAAGRWRGSGLSRNGNV